MKIDALEYRIGTLEAFLDFDPNAPADDEWPDSIHNLVADGMTGVTQHCEARIDRLTWRIDAIQDLLLKLVDRLEALEQKAPC